VYVVVDSDLLPGQDFSYRLRIDFHPLDDWYERDVAKGVRVRTKRYLNLFDSIQSTSTVVVEKDTPGVRFKTLVAQSCTTTSQLAREVGAVAAINGGYFGGSNCASTSLLYADGTT